MTKVHAAAIALLLVQIAATAAVAQQKVPDVSGWRFKTTTITLGRVDTPLVRFVSAVYVPTNRLRDDRGDKDKL